MALPRSVESKRRVSQIIRPRGFRASTAGQAMGFRTRAHVLPESSFCPSTLRADDSEWSAATLKQVALSSHLSGHRGVTLTVGLSNCPLNNGLAVRCCACGRNYRQ